jgi:hypothetical protein
MKKNAISAGSRRALAIAAVLVAVAFFVYTRSEETHARKSLSSIAEALSAPLDATREIELRKTLSEFCTPEVQVNVPDVFVGSGRDRAIDAVLRTLNGARPVISLENIQLQSIDSGSRFQASFDARVSDSQTADLHADIRQVTAVLVKSADRWQLDAVTSSPKDSRQPEARP